MQQRPNDVAVRSVGFTFRVQFEPHFRVLELNVERFRNLHDIHLVISPETSLVCLVGENGTGKTTVLELLGMIASKVGLARGVENLRGDSGQHQGTYSARIQVSTEPASALGELQSPHSEWAASWDGTLTIHSDGRIYAGEPDDRGNWLGSHVSGVVRSVREVFYLFLDADRSYPPTAVQPHEYGQLMQRPWETIEDRLNSAFRLSRTLYGEWISFMVAKEGQSATRLQQAHRRAKVTGDPLPEFVDPFASYTDSLQQVLPHLRFSTVDMNRLMPLFDTAGAELNFSGLSGGEREIAFLVGQIDRFRLRHGLLLVDEPELHLNPDLVRTWIAFLRDSVADGQVWIATHSLEAVEAAGPEASFLFERDAASREVGSVAQLADRPVVLALSGALGTPAFALSRHKFVFVEGERASAERERFHRLCGSEGIRFIEAGGCRSVISKRTTIAELGVEADTPIHVGAIVDRDFRGEAEVAELQASGGTHVLGCHEVENLMLHPPTLDALLRQNGKGIAAADLVQATSDRFAGLWVFRRAMYTCWSNQTVPTWTQTSALKRAIAVGWSNLDDNPDAFFSLPMALGLVADGNDDQLRLDIELRAAHADYRELRGDETRLWRETLGKEVARSIPREVGFSDFNAFERNTIAQWASGTTPPNDVVELRRYVAELGPAV